MSSTILSVRNLHVVFTLRGRKLHALRGIDLDVADGESLAIVGESGSGKSVLNKNFIGLLDQNGSVTGGFIRYYGMGDKMRHYPGAGSDENGDYIDLTAFRKNEDWLRIRGSEICMIPQDPMTSLNPLKSIGWQISEALMLHRGMTKSEAKEEAIRMLKLVGIPLPERRFKDYPHSMSGGMRQRVMIAMALSCNPSVLIADEPTTALDVTIQAQILDLMLKLRDELGTAIIMIARSDRGYYDAVLMDIQMPGIDGYEATRNIRRMYDYEHANLPVIAMTANAFDEDMEKARSAGMNAYLAKPVEPGALMEALRQILPLEQPDHRAAAPKDDQTQ